MAKKRLGYIELHWECPNCSTINPGSEKVCRGCSAPMPEGVEMFQPTQQQLIEDEERLKKAKAGADIRCAYCGTLNPAGSTTCSQCKADLAEGQQRKAGEVVGAYRQGAVPDVPCPHCGSMNPETASRCAQCGGSLGKPSAPAAAESSAKRGADGNQPAGRKKGGVGILAVVGIIFALICVAIYFIFLRTTALTGTVTDVEWERSVVLEGLVPVEYQDWQDEIPADGEIVSCEQEKRGESDQKTENSVEVCGTPYNVDTGGGFAEVVQDCIYEVYDDYCTYTVVEWSAVDTVVVGGQDFNAYWPDPSLTQDQRLGEGEEQYVIVFSADGDIYTYTTSNYDLYQQAQIGTRWELEVNSIGGVQSISP